MFLWISSLETLELYDLRSRTWRRYLSEQSPWLQTFSIIHSCCMSGPPSSYLACHCIERIGDKSCFSALSDLWGKGIGKVKTSSWAIIMLSDSVLRGMSTEHWEKGLCVQTQGLRRLLGRKKEAIKRAKFGDMEHERCFGWRVTFFVPCYRRERSWGWALRCGWKSRQESNHNHLFSHFLQCSPLSWAQWEVQRLVADVWQFFGLLLSTLQEPVNNDLFPRCSALALLIKTRNRKRLPTLMATWTFSDGGYEMGTMKICYVSLPQKTYTHTYTFFFFFFFFFCCVSGWRAGSNSSNLFPPMSFSVEGFFLASATHPFTSISLSLMTQHYWKIGLEAQGRKPESWRV